MALHQVSTAEQGRKDLAALGFGILFSLLLTGLIWWAGRFLADVPLLPDQGVAWYYWKLPNPTWVTRLSAWLPYLLHQFALWGLIAYAQKRQLRYTGGLHPVNYLALGINGLFALLHVAQTHLFYDGLAQDVSIFSSQGSVILLLVLVLIMENSRRGLFFGRPAPIPAEAVRAVRTYHGYFFAWAIVYTFWYHPMVSTTGHLVGTLYTLLLMLQGSLFFTRIHVNRWWTLAQELAVLAHGTLVAVQQGNDLWPMFFFGFGGIFVITQMHGLGWSRLTRWLVGSGFVVLIAAVYAGKGWGRLNEVARIPIIDYLLVFIVAWLVLGLARLFRRRAPASR